MREIDAALVVDDDYLPLLIRLLDEAKGRVDLIAYSFSIPKKVPESAPLQVLNKLIEAKERGVDVRVYIEDHRETAARNRPTAKLLERGGVRVVYGWTHAKGIFIDGRVLFGSTNLSQQSLTKNIETNLLFDDTHTSTGFERYFEHLWRGGRHGGITLDPPMIADGAFANALIEMIEAAKSSIDFSIYFFHHTALQEALIDAHRRGVTVRGLIHNHNAFAMSFVRRTRGTAYRLYAGGVTNLFFGPTTLFTHSKFLVRDQKEILLGTGNWLHEDIKIHPQLAVRFESEKVGSELVSHLAKTIEARGTPVEDVSLRRSSQISDF